MARGRRSSNRSPSSSRGRLALTAAAAAAAALCLLAAPATAAPTAAQARPPLRILTIGDSLTVGSVPSLWQNRPYSIEMTRRLEAAFKKADELAGGAPRPPRGSALAAAEAASEFVMDNGGVGDDGFFDQGPELAMMAMTDDVDAAARAAAASAALGREVVVDPYAVIGGAGVIAEGPYERKQTLTEASLEALKRGFNGTGLPFDFAVVFCGINDLLRIGKSADEVANALEVVYDAVQNAGVRIIALPPLAAPGFVGPTDYKEAERLKLANLIKASAARRNARAALESARVPAGTAAALLLNRGGVNNNNATTVATTTVAASRLLLEAAEQQLLSAPAPGALPGMVVITEGEPGKALDLWTRRDWLDDGLHLKPVAYDKIGEVVAGTVAKVLGIPEEAVKAAWREVDAAEAKERARGKPAVVAAAPKAKEGAKEAAAAAEVAPAAAALKAEAAKEVAREAPKKAEAPVAPTAPAPAAAVAA